MHLGDRDNAARIGRVHQIADIDLPQGRPRLRSAKWILQNDRFSAAVAIGRVIALQIGRWPAFDRRLLRIELLAAGEIRPRQGGVTLQIELVVLQLRGRIGCALGLGLRQQGRIGARIDHGQQVAGL